VSWREHWTEEIAWQKIVQHVFAAIPNPHLPRGFYQATDSGKLSPRSYRQEIEDSLQQAAGNALAVAVQRRLPLLRLSPKGTIPC
jgi:hypothetical protein